MSNEALLALSKALVAFPTPSGPVQGARCASLQLALGAAPFGEFFRKHFSDPSRDLGSGVSTASGLCSGRAGALLANSTTPAKGNPAGTASFPLLPQLVLLVPALAGAAGIWELSFPAVVFAALGD